MFLCIEMETGVMDGWYSDLDECMEIITYYQSLFPMSRWISMSYISGDKKRISDELFYHICGSAKMIRKYGEPQKIY